MRIGELARLTGKSVAALRYYEQTGLLREPLRTQGGYRDYPPGTVERVRFILRAKERGFTLREIAAILSSIDRGKTPCESVARISETKVARLDQQIAKLRKRREGLTEAVRLWQSGLLRDGDFCPMLSISESGAGNENNERRPLEMARTIEVFTAGCPLCDETLKHVREAFAPCGCNVVARAADSPEAAKYGVTAVPTVVAEGQVVFVGKPALEQVIALARR